MQTNITPGTPQEKPQENPADKVKELMLQAKQKALGERAFLSAEDHSAADKIASLSGITMLSAYENWRNQLEDSEVVTNLRNTLQEAIEQRDHFREKAFHDELTGAYTRHYFTDYLQRKVHAIDSARMAPKNRRAEEDEAIGFSLLAIDIDHFKGINDSYGHDVGDEVLKQLVDVLKNHLRDDDLVVRLGGEEFIVYLKAGADQAERIAEKLRETVETEISKAREYEDKGTISIGVTSYSSRDTENLTPDELKKRADEALYHSKNTGRNKVTVYSPDLITDEDVELAEEAEEEQAESVPETLVAPADS